MHIIILQVHDEKELYNSFSPDEDLLSDDVKNYIRDRLKTSKNGEDTEIQIQADGPIDEDRIRRSFANWVEEEQSVSKTDFRRNVIQQSGMFLFGAAAIALSLILQSQVNAVFFTIVSTVGTYSVWESASIWFVRNPKLLKERKLIRKLSEHVRICVQTK